MNSTVEQIKEKLSIVDVVSQYITLEKSGTNYKGKSPFTNEKTPSFFVSPERNLYHCFSSGKGGDIFTFVSEMEGVDFKGALRILAERAGVTLSKEGKDTSDLRDRLFQIMKDTTYLYSESLKRKKDALEYAEARGINKESIERFRIGYAPSGWDTAYVWLTKKAKHRPEDIIRAGIAKKNDQGKTYDRLRGRLIFPIADPAGRVIAFTGRILPNATSKDATAKYINSPETDLYKKSEVLFGFDLAKQTIRKEEEVVIMEGQMDVVLSHQYGFTNSIALSGTALSNEQVNLIARLAKSILFAFDSDSAGEKALLKSSAMALRKGLSVYTVFLPEGKDPADILTEQKREGWENILKHKVHVITHFINTISEKEQDRHARQKRIAEIVYPLIASIDSRTERGYFIHETANALVGVNDDTIASEIQNVPVDLPEIEIAYPENKQTKEIKRLDALSEHVVALLEWQKLKQQPLVDVPNAYTKLKEIFGDSLQEVEKNVLNKKDLLFTIELFYESEKEKLPIILDVLIKEIQILYLTKARDTLFEKLHRAESEKDTRTANKLLSEIQDTSQKIEKVKHSQNTY
ncbi:MAG: DNA primase [Candidatus Paceibacterota bacterium]